MRPIELPADMQPGFGEFGVTVCPQCGTKLDGPEQVLRERIETDLISAIRNADLTGEQVQVVAQILVEKAGPEAISAAIEAVPEARGLYAGVTTPQSLTLLVTALTSLIAILGFVVQHADATKARETARGDARHATAAAHSDAEKARATAHRDAQAAIVASGGHRSADDRSQARQPGELRS